jgi:hypothetical protein
MLWLAAAAGLWARAVADEAHNPAASSTYNRESRQSDATRNVDFGGYRAFEEYTNTEGRDCVVDG